MFSIHHDDPPYQPCKLRDIEYGDAPVITTEEEAIRLANETRGPAMVLLAEAMAAAGDAPMLVTGDYNEPSGLDGTEAAVAAG